MGAIYHLSTVIACAENYMEGFKHGIALMGGIFGALVLLAGIAYWAMKRN